MTDYERGYQQGYADAMNWKTQNHLEHLPGREPISPRPWIGLTDEDFQPMVKKAMAYYGYKPEHSTLTSGAGFYKLVRNIEAKLKEKNT
jgi:hypothetical protein